jgi:hypothetical protein
LAKNLAKSGGILSRKRKVVVFRKFCTKSGGFMLLTLSYMYSWVISVDLFSLVENQLQNNLLFGCLALEMSQRISAGTYDVQLAGLLLVIIGKEVYTI